ncbi:MAG: GAF domain-containing protein [Trueperaceae bacterium]|nr:GAF domain-containing protein [Trueperaceae bacterium]
MSEGNDGANDGVNDAGTAVAVDYAALTRAIEALWAGERDPVANLANLSAAVMDAHPALNWAGIYVRRGDELVVGPFQGKPACVRIAYGRGVCGTAWAEDATQVVADVHAFPGHIACDPASRSEIVVPMRDASGVLRAVLDLDSDRPATFGEADRVGLEALVATLAPQLDWDALG